MSTAFVLSGGGSLGAVQVGMLRALATRRIEPDLLIGTSVGALNAAHVAGHGTREPSLDRLAGTWSRLRRRDVFPLDPARLAAAAIGRAPSLCASGPLRQLILDDLAFDRLEDAPIPLHVVAADVTSGQEVLLSEGDAIDAILASAAIPAIFPSVRLGQRDLIDGGVADHAAVSQAVSLGADLIYLLPAGYACALDRPPSTPLSSALHALSLLIEQRLVVEVAHYSPHVDIRVLPPLCPLSVSSVDFRHGRLLIDRAEAVTGRWLDGGGTDLPHQERFLSMHAHHIRRGPAADRSVDDDGHTEDAA